MAANSGNPFLDSVNAWGERGMAFWNSMMREPAASPFLSPSMTGFMPPGMSFPGMPPSAPSWNPFGNVCAPSSGSGMDWMGQAQQFYQALQQAMGSLPDLRQMDVAGIAEQWRKAMHDSMAAPRMPSAFTQTWQQTLDTPGLGFAREHQGRWQEWLKARDAYLAVMQRYGQKMQAVQVEGMRRFEQRLQAHSAPDKQLKSMRAVFDLWVDASEEAFAEAALADDYRHLYGELVNAQMRLRAAGQAIMDSASASMGLPTRAELEGAHRKTHALKLELREIKRRLQMLEQRRPTSVAEPVAATETRRAGVSPPSSMVSARRSKPLPTAAAKPVSKASATLARQQSSVRRSEKPRTNPAAKVSAAAPAQSAKVLPLKRKLSKPQPLIAVPPPPAIGKASASAAGKSTKRKGG
jgi:class III poly(R)-hydroxyalkanoic acid synthase PhaE subunit